MNCFVFTFIVTVLYIELAIEKTYTLIIRVFIHVYISYIKHRVYLYDNLIFYRVYVNNVLEQ